MTAEDAALWRRLVQTIKPLQQPRHRCQKSAIPPDPSPPSVSLASQHLDDDRQTVSSPQHPLPSTTRSPAEPLVIGATPGLDRRAADRLKRGQWPIEATLDLHGYRCATARNTVMNFIEQSYTQQKRCLRVVTGKGTPGDIKTGWRGQGVLRVELVNWLNTPAVRPLILSCVPAQPRDGGGGAFYILLRRRR